MDRSVRGESSTGPPPASPPSRAPTTSHPLRVAFLLCAIGFVAGALFHAAALVRPSIAEPAPPWRHALFVGVNAALAVGILVRPKWFLYVFVLFTLEQVWGHGVSLVRVAGEGRLDWASVVVLVFVPAMLGLLVLDARRRG